MFDENVQFNYQQYKENLFQTFDANLYYWDLMHKTLKYYSLCKIFKNCVLIF